jgi:uncharacterized protein involved in high-affinity Fe2+ transport
MTVLVLLPSVACVTRAYNLEEGPRSTEVGRSSEPQVPLHQLSDEVDEAQWRLALRQGEAVGRAVRHVLDHALAGAITTAGEYQLLVALQPATSQGQVHLLVAPRDGYDGRLVPELKVRARWSAQGHAAGEVELSYTWDPVLQHFGADVALDPGVPYDVRVEIERPEFRRHDPVNGDRFRAAAWAEIDGLQLREARAADPDAARALARDQGDAIAEALNGMIAGEAADGATMRSGEYVVAYAVEYAEGYWRPHGDGLCYAAEVEESARENAHVEVAVLDAATGRFLPGLHVHARVIDAGGQVVAEVAPALMWHPWLLHYGANTRVPGAGRYALEVWFDAPDWRRPPGQFTEGAHVRFEDVDIRTGQK